MPTQSIVGWGRRCLLALHDSLDFADPLQGGLPDLELKDPILGPRSHRLPAIAHQGLEVLALLKGILKLPLELGPFDEIPALQKTGQISHGVPGPNSAHRSRPMVAGSAAAGACPWPDGETAAPRHAAVDDRPLAQTRRSDLPGLDGRSARDAPAIGGSGRCGAREQAGRSAGPGHPSAAAAPANG